MKIYKLYFIIIYSAVMLTSCLQSKKSDSIRNLKLINVDVSKVADYYDIAPDVEIDWDIIALETADDYLISYIDKIICENNKYFVLDKRTASIFIFDKDGRFVNKLDKKGPGPEEYSDITSFEVIGNNIWVIDANIRSLICYDMNLNFVKKIKTNIRADDMCNIQNQIYLATNWTGYGKKNYQLESYNFHSNKIKSYLKVPSNNPMVILIGKSRQLAQYGDSALFFYSYCNTIFQIKENSVEPAYQLNFSERYEDIPLTTEQMLDPNSTKIRGILNIDYTGKSIIFEYADQRELRTAIYNEENAACNVYSTFRKSDLGNLKILLRRFTKNREMICFYDPETFLKYYNEVIDDTKFKKESDRQRIKNIITGLKEDDNPILIKFKLKDNSTI